MLSSASMSTDLKSILPMIMICGIACLLLFGDILLWKRSKSLNPLVAIVGILGTLAVLMRGMPWSDDRIAFAGAIKADSMYGVSSCILLLTALLAVLLAWTYLKSRDLDH